MSEKNPSDVKLNENPNGTVSFATEVVATIAGLAATEVDGVASMISPSSGLADMFSRKSNRNLTKGVRIDLDGNKVTVDITITVDYGSPIPDVARSIQENVKKAIETMSGLDVHSVDVHVTGISFEREQRANAELDEQQRKMLEKTEESIEEAVTAEAAAKVEPAAEEAVAEEVEPEEEDDIDLEEDDDIDLEEEDDIDPDEEEFDEEDADDTDDDEDIPDEAEDLVDDEDEDTDEAEEEKDAEA